MHLLYTLLACLAAPVAFGQVLWRSLSDPAYRSGWAERFGRGEGIRGRGCIWVHAVSMGEVSAAAPLVRALRRQYADWPLVLTTATPTGARRARELFEAAGVDVRYGPYDTPRSVARFFDRVRPRLAIFMETELWPNLHRECARRSVPRIIASARISARSWPRYRRLRALTRPMLADGITVAAQTQADAERFRELGAPAAQVLVAGNLKFDVSVDGDVRSRGVELRTAVLRGRTAWTAGSTHGGEEERVLDAHALVRASVPDALLVLAPRHPQRFDAVASLLERRAINFVRRSAAQAVQPETEVLLLDCVGELAAFYAASQAAFVGGSLAPIGGHNLLEPAALGVPVATGPHQSNSVDVAKRMFDSGAAVRVEDAIQLAAAISGWLMEPGESARIGALGRSVVAANRGALQRLLTLVAQRLPAEAAGGPPGSG
ncbi:MAG: lipid IV(A) 3-deoxy-D-manno-octulosonic acid transferase [Proteobacteria bacterium]|nr:lipid IV(A) 3-deoxy-D-manno-octulosonic acid transferase [Pseudomonadota bacterium]